LAVSFAIRDDPFDPMEAECQAFLNGVTHVEAITCIAVTEPHTQWPATIPTDAETQENLLEVRPAVLGMARGGARGCGACRRFIGAIEGNRRRILMEPRRGDGIGLQSMEGDGSKHLVEMGGEEGIQNLAQAGVMDRRTGESWLQQRQHPTLVEAPANCVEGMVTVENGQDKGCHPTPRRYTCSGGGGMSVSMSLATSSLRSIPSTKGKWATGATVRMETTMMNLLARSWNRVHHNATSGPVRGYLDKCSRLASKPLEDKYIYPLDSE
jgi:hypothetical protein